MLTFGSLFAGIGGFDLGFERAGMQCQWQVEIDDYATKVLEKHWPHVARYRDIRDCGSHNLSPVDVICGGFPCQDISTAGTGKGLSGERSGLWSEYARLVCEIRPRYVVIENSAALIDRGLERVLCDLAACGYDAEWQIVRASDFALPHRRERIIIVAYADCEHGETRLGGLEDGAKEVFTGGDSECLTVRVQAPSDLAGKDAGLPAQSYADRVRCVGNAIAVPVAEWVGRKVIEFNSSVAGSTSTPAD